MYKKIETIDKEQKEIRRHNHDVQIAITSYTTIKGKLPNSVPSLK